jgi:hypothetical protein
MVISVPSNTFEKMGRGFLLTDKAETDLPVESFEVVKTNAPTSSPSDQYIERLQHKGSNPLSLLVGRHLHAAKHKNAFFRTEPDDADDAIAIRCGNDEVLWRSAAVVAACGVESFHFSKPAFADTYEYHRYVPFEPCAG